MTTSRTTLIDVPYRTNLEVRHSTVNERYGVKYWVNDDEVEYLNNHDFDNPTNIDGTSNSTLGSLQ